MKLTKQRSLCAVLGLGTSLAWMVLSGTARAQGFTTTTVQGTVYLANGHPGSGSLQVSWPAFTTANNQAVAAGRVNVSIGADGYVSLNLAANLGATPAGLYYTAVYHLSDGTTSTEYWVVPAAAQASLSQVRAQVMPAAQAVQAVSKAYVDQSVQELTQSLLTASGGSLSGPLFLNGDPSQPTQAASKHYVDAEFGMAVPMSGGALTGPLTSVQLGAAYQVDQFPGADFGAKLQACLNTLNATYGGTCDARNFSGNLVLSSSLVIGKANATVELPCATISTSNQIRIPAGIRNVTLHGCALRGASASSGSAGGTVFSYSGTGAMMQVGDPTYGVDTSGFHMDNAVINTTVSTSSAAKGLAAYRTQEMSLASLYFLGNSNQTGITLDGTGNYTGGTFQDIELGGFGTAVNAIGHQTANAMTTDWLNASTFLRLHIDCPTNGGTPMAGTYGINLQQGDGNTFTGGDVEGCSTALHLGPNAQNNTIVGLRNENSINQVVADAGSSYNNWITGGTMFTGQLTDNGTRNSFLDTFHRSFNGLNGDWYGSQQDATVTNHFRLGTGNGNERGLLNRYQTDAGYRWTTGFSDATAGEQFYQVLDELNNVYRLSIGQYNNGQSSSNNQTVINAAGSGAVVLNGSSNSGTGGIIFGSGGANPATVGSINNSGNAQFNGTLQVGGPSTFTNSTTVKNQTDAEIDSFLWAGATSNQKESYTYKDYTGASQWYMVKDASNNWALNSATGGLDSFKAYQSSNSGDTYINASNPTGHIRLNYETGSGAETDIYSGASSGLVAAFLGSTAIKFPGLAAASGHNCLQIDNSGYISNSGSACGTSQNGTVNTGSAGQVAYYTGNGSVIAGTNAVGVNAGGTGASSAAQALQNLGAQSVLTGVASDGALGIAVAGNVAAPATLSSVNKVISVIAPPYNAKCDGVTDDQAAIQAAFNDALPGSGNPLCTANGCSIQFPAGTCLTSAIVWKGQPFFGAGITATTIQGKPGQDVFATPDNTSWPAPAAGTLVHDIRIRVDTSVDASGAPQGNNTFPNRIAGTLGGGTAVSPAISPGPEAFGPTVSCSGTISGASLNTITFSGAFCPTADTLQNIDSWRVVGAPITINGVGPSGGNLTTTIASVTGPNTVTLTTPATSSGSSLSGTYLNPVTPPYYIGNCGFAFPDSNGSGTFSNIQNFQFAEVQIIGVNGPHKGNHTCGMFVQTPPYELMMNKVQIQNLWGGYIEARPATNPNGRTWTGDTSSFKNIDFQFNMLPMIIMQGNHRTFEGINVYGGSQHQALGPMWLENGSSATISRMYFECQTTNTGEISRYTGGAGINIQGGGLDQCNGANSYVLWNASFSTVSADVRSLQIASGVGYNNLTLNNLQAPNFVDNGFANVVTSNGGTNPSTVQRVAYVNRPRPPVGMFTGSYLTAGSANAPYLNQDDLITTCQDMGVLFNQPTIGTCVSDLTGSELSLLYFQSAGPTTIVDGLSNAGASNIWANYPRVFGTHIPQAHVNVHIRGEAVGASSFTAVLLVKDGTTNATLATSGTLTFGSTWTQQDLLNVDLTGATTGDQLDYRIQSVTNAGTNYRIASIEIQPINQDEHTWLANNGLPVSGGTLLPATNSGVLCTGPASGITSGHVMVASGTNCNLADGGAVPAAVITSVPLWLQFYGDGSESALNCTSGTCPAIQAGEHYYSTCNVSAGAIQPVSSSGILTGGPIIIRCSTSATIAGTISYSNNTGSSPGVVGTGNFGGGGGGGGFGSANGAAGGGFLGTLGGGVAGTSGVAGGNGTVAPAQLQRMFASGAYSLVNGYQCGGSSGGQGGSSGGAGGRGGGCVIITSPVFSFTGTCDVSGQNGGAGGSSTGGGGGGAGGVCLFRSPSMTNSGTFVLTGGAGGAIGTGTSTVGGAGANGWSKVFTQ
jgi:hypothetical protein